MKKSQDKMLSLLAVAKSLGSFVKFANDGRCGLPASWCESEKMRKADEKQKLLF